MSRKVILFKNERLLIEQVKSFPVIYDKTHKDYRKAVITEQCWTEISEATGEEAINCKKRWKSLRDTFIKYYRLELMDNDATTSNNKKKKKWVYYNELSFLKPHVELFGINDTIEVKKVDESSSEQPTVYEIEYQIENEEENSLVEVQTFSTENKQDSSEPITTEFMIDSNPQSNSNKKTIEIYQKDSPKKVVESIGSKSRQDQASETIIEEIQSTPNASSTLCLDADEKFLLSCAPALKRLTPRQNAYVRFNIQKLLYDVEFGSSDDEDAAISKRKKMKH